MAGHHVGPALGSGGTPELGPEGDGREGGSVRWRECTESCPCSAFRKGVVQSELVPTLPGELCFLAFWDTQSADTESLGKESFVVELLARSKGGHCGFISP